MRELDATTADAWEDASDGPALGGRSEYRRTGRPSMISIDLKIAEPLPSGTTKPLASGTLGIVRTLLTSSRVSRSGG